MQDTSKRLHPVAMAAHAAVVAIMGAAALGAGIPAVQAQESVSSAARKFYQIPAGPLGAALMGFAVQAGVNLSVDLDKLAGMKAPGLSGTYTVDEGFAKLLADSGLRARVVSTGNYALASAPKNPPDVVPAPAKASTPHAVTPAAQDAKELATVTVSVTRLEQSTEDAPQNIRVISRDEIDKQLAQKEVELMAV